MPKQPGGFTKFQRMEALRSVLNRWGKLNKRQIDEYVAENLGCAPDDVARALYRDLEELEAMSQVTALRFTRDGQRIENYDPDLHKNTICEWSATGETARVLGGASLKKSDLSLAVSKRLENFVSVAEASAPAPGKIGFHFRFAGKQHSLFVEREALPFRFWLTRVREGESPSKIFETGEAHFGKRLICLQVPLLSVSGLKDAGPSGHLSFSMNEPEFGILLDCASKNGTFYAAMDPAEVPRLMKKSDSKKKSTATYQISRMSMNSEILKLDSGKEIKLSLPLRIFATQDFIIYVINH